MRRTRLIAFAAAAMTAVLIITAGCTSEKQTTTQVPVAAKQIDLKSVLLPVKEHPEGSQVNPIMPLWEAVSRFLPGTGEPSGIVVYPRCVSYFAAIGGLDKLDGWYQWGTRANGAIYVHFVAKVPRPEALEMIRLRVNGCSKGHQTIQGWPPSATGGGEIVGSTLAFTERQVPELQGASTYGLTQSITFDKPDNALVKTIRGAWQCTAGPCNSYDAFVAKDDYLIWIHEGANDQIADKMAKTLYDRLVKIL